MASSSVHEQLERVGVMVERAARERFAAGRARREAFQELIALTHSRHPLLKSYAAGHIHHFFNDFPDLEEDAINAVYDLCEDDDSNVRMDGYHAVTRVSSVQHKWIKRNTDVLVQLLQSDEPEENAVVKVALLEHLDMDPPAMLGVLCDQIVPLEEDLDDDARQTKERLRSLVLSFLATDAMGTIQKYTDPPGSEAEHVLVAQLILAVTRLDTGDVDIIVKDILSKLPCYRGDSRGDELLQVIIDKATTLLQTPSNDPVQLQAALHYLSVAQMATVNLHATPAVKLLQFYIGFLTRRLALQKFLPEDRIRVISWAMEALSVSERDTATQTQQIAQLRRQIVDASPILLDVLFDSKLYRDDLWCAVKSILQTINTRKERENWILPQYLITAISKFLRVLPRRQTQDVSEIQGLIRLLTREQPSSSQAPTQEVNPMVKNGTALDRPAHLPQRPITSLPPLSDKLDVPMTWTSIATQQSPVRDNASLHFHISSIPTPPKRSGSTSEDVPRSKRVKMNSRGHDVPTPSLLSRIADAGDASSGGPSERTGKKRKKRSEKEQEQSPEPDRHPSTGYSIKGAASAQRTGSGSSFSSSLLDRMRREDT